jgi:hypothetical protein
VAEERQRLGASPLPPFGVIVVAGSPLHLVLLGQQLVHLAHPYPLDAAQLLDAAPGRRLLLEAQGVHFADHLEPGRIVQGQPRLVEQPVGPRPARLAGSVETRPRLADPDQQTPDPRGERHRRMGNSGTGFQHQARHSADGYVGAHPVLVDQHEGPVEDIELAPVDEEDREAVFHGDRFERWQDGFGHWLSPLSGLILQRQVFNIFKNMRKKLG